MMIYIDFYSNDIINWFTLHAKNEIFYQYASFIAKTLLNFL